MGDFILNIVVSHDDRFTVYGNTGQRNWRLYPSDMWSEFDVRLGNSCDFGELFSCRHLCNICANYKAGWGGRCMDRSFSGSVMRLERVHGDYFLGDSIICCVCDNSWKTTGMCIHALDCIWKLYRMAIYKAITKVDQKWGLEWIEFDFIIAAMKTEVLLWK